LHRIGDNRLFAELHNVFLRQWGVQGATRLLLVIRVSRRADCCQTDGDRRRVSDGYARADHIADINNMVNNRCAVSVAGENGSGVSVSKYGAKPRVVDGVRFDSRAEARRYAELKLLEMAGEISGLAAHPRFVLQAAFRRGAELVRAIEYEADFQYQETASGATVVEDVKGVETEAFRIKRRMFLYNYPGVEFRIISVRRHG